MKIWQKIAVEILCGLLLGLVSSSMFAWYDNKSELIAFIDSIDVELRQNKILFNDFSQKEDNQVPLYPSQIKTQVYNVQWPRFKDNFKDKDYSTLVDVYNNLVTMQNEIDRTWDAAASGQSENAKNLIIEIRKKMMNMQKNIDDTLIRLKNKRNGLLLSKIMFHSDTSQYLEGNLTDQAIRIK